MQPSHNASLSPIKILTLFAHTYAAHTLLIKIKRNQPPQACVWTPFCSLHYICTTSAAGCKSIQILNMGPKSPFLEVSGKKLFLDRGLIPPCHLIRCRLFALADGRVPPILKDSDSGGDGGRGSNCSVVMRQSGGRIRPLRTGFLYFLLDSTGLLILTIVIAPVFEVIWLIFSVCNVLVLFNAVHGIFFFFFFFMMFFFFFIRYAPNLFNIKHTNT